MYANEVETKEKQKLPEIKKITTTYLLYFTWYGFGEVNVMKIINENFVQ